MHSRKFLLYSRGFMGSVENATQSTSPIKKKTLLSVFNLAPEEMERIVVNEQVVQAYNQLLRRQVISTDFDWREKVIKVALRSFGTLNVKEWIKACEMSPLLTKNHTECIEDWIRFCTTGKRKLPVITWERLIAAGVNEPTNPATVDKGVINSLPQGYSSINNTITGDNNLVSLITMALEKPGGYTDLVITLYTFFGENIH